MSRYRTPRPLRVTASWPPCCFAQALLAQVSCLRQRPSPMIHGPVSYSIFSTTVQ